MGSFFNITNRLRNTKYDIQNIIGVELLLMSFFPIIPNTIKPFPIIVLLLSTLYFFLKVKLHGFNIKIFIINSSIYIIYLISILYTSNLGYAFKKLETSLSLLIIPLIFAMLEAFKNQINKKKLENDFIKLFYWGVFTYSITILLFLGYKGLFKYYNDPNFVRHFTETIPFIGQHPIYASIFLGLGLLFSMHLICHYHIIGKLKVVLFSCFLISLLISLASKGVIISFAISACLYGILKGKKLKIKILVISSIISFGLLATILSPALSIRMNSMFKSLSLLSTSKEMNSTELRKEIYLCSIDLIKEKWIIGRGIGDVKDSLMDCYRSNRIELVIGNFNSHNQYFSILIGTGIIGLFVMVIFLYFNLKQAISLNDPLFLCVLIFYIAVMLTENILERQSGVILFSFLINFFLFVNENEFKSKNKIGS